MRCHTPNAAGTSLADVGRWFQADGQEPASSLALSLVLNLGFGGLHGSAADDLAHFAGLFRERAHLRLDILAVQTHHLAQILGMQQRLRVVQRGLDVLLGIAHRLSADVLRTCADRLAALFDRTRGRLSAGKEFLEALARLVEARICHGSHVFRDFKTVMPIFVHGPTPVALARALAPLSAQAIGKTLRRRRFGSAKIWIGENFAGKKLSRIFGGVTQPRQVHRSWTFAGVMQDINARSTKGFEGDPKIKGYPGLWRPQPWTCLGWRAIITLC